MVKYLTFALLALASTAWGYSGGAPESVCEDMTPKHPVAPQRSRLPYTVSVSKKEINAGDKVDITISGGNPFKGYMLEVRDGDKAIGSFEIADTDKYSKTVNCFGNKASAATHKNSAEKKTVTLTWKSPAGKKGNVKVYATVAEDGGKFWVRKPTQTIKLN